MQFSSSLSSSPSASTGPASRGDADPLLTFLPTAGSPHAPRLVWYSTPQQGERIELSGHVLFMWASKIAGFISAEAPFPAHVELATGRNWRTLCWAAGAWLAGAQVSLTGDDHATAQPQTTPPLPTPDMSVAFTPEQLNAQAEVQVLLPRPALALAYDGELPAMVLDGAADVMTYPDSFDAVRMPGNAPALLTEEGVLSRADLAQRATSWVRPEATATQQGPALVDVSQPGRMLKQLLGLWSQGRCGVVVDPGAGDPAQEARRCAQIAAQESATPLPPGPSPHGH